MSLLEKLAVHLQQDEFRHLLKVSPPFQATLPLNVLHEIEEFIRLYFNLTHREGYVSSRRAKYAQEQKHFSAMMSYDFHINGNRRKLIEVNTNAGGCLFSLAAEFLHPVASQDKGRLHRNERSLHAILDSFQEEFRLWSEQNNKSGKLKSIAILDEDVGNVYWLPEFHLFKRLFEEAGISARVADISEVAIDSGKLVVGGEEIDLVYNRYCDFYFRNERSGVLREAYERNLTCFTPNPYEYHLTADKEILSLLSLGGMDDVYGISEGERKLLDTYLLKTRLLNEVGEEEMEENRKRYIFKPRTYYGGKGVYRGDKISVRKLMELERNDYLMQELEPPSEVTVDSSLCDYELKSNDFKVDYRFYAYKDKVFHVAARYFQGQVTNFQAPGSGIVPVSFVPEESV